MNDFFIIKKIKNSAKILPIIFATILVIGFFFSVYQFSVLSTKAINVNGHIDGTVPIEKIEFSFDKTNWAPYVDFFRLSKFDRNDTMYIRGTFPKKIIVSPVMELHTKNNYAALYVDGKLWDSNLKNYSERASGDVYNIFNLEHDYPGKDFLIELKANKSQNIGLINSIEIRNKFYVYADNIYLGLGLTIFSIFSIIIGFIITLTIVSKKYRLDGIHYIGIFSILVGLFWYSNTNIFSNVFFQNNYASTIFSYFIMYLFPLPVIKYIKNFDRVNSPLYNNIFFYYLIVLIFILTCDMTGIISLEDWFPYTTIFFVIIILMALYIYTFKLFNKVTYNVKTQYDNLTKYTLPLFIIETLAITYDIYIIFNTSNIISKNYLTPLTHTIFLLFNIYIISKDLKRFNESFILTSENVKINKICINKLVYYQSHLFANLSYSTLKNDYINIISDFLYPTKNQFKIPIKNLISEATYNDFYKNHDDFLLYSSSYIYMTKPESIFSTNDEKAIIISASGIYTPYINTDPYETMGPTMIKKLNLSLSSGDTITKDSIILKIGSSEAQHGVMVFENIGYLSDNQIALLESYMSTVAILLENDFLLNIAKKSQANTVFNLNEFSELRSKETGNHIRRVSLYSRLIGSKLGLAENDLETLHLASSMHDIGKINIPDAILNKPGKLTDEEFTVMKTHSYEGFKILRNIKNPIMEAGSIVAYYHHERYDGKGLYGLKGEEIPIFARIVAVADVFDALFSKRVYKDAWHLQSILELFDSERDKQFDNKIVEILFENIDELLEIKNNFSDDD